MGGDSKVSYPTHKILAMSSVVYKWVVGLFVAAMLFVWLYETTERYERLELEAYELWQNGNEEMADNNYTAAVEYYESAFDKVEGDTIVSRIVTCMKRMGNTAGALKWLNKYEEIDRKSDFTAMRRASIYLEAKDTSRARTILDKVISTPAKLQTGGFGRTMLDSWLYKNSDYTDALNHYIYYTDYYAKLLALKFRMQIAQSNSERLELGEKLFCLVEDCENDYAIMSRYLQIKRGEAQPYNSLYGSLAVELADIESHIKCNIINAYANPTIIVESVSQLKWDMFNRLIARKHLDEGYQAAVDYAKRITADNTRNTDTYANFYKYLYGVYLGASGDSRFNTELTVADLDQILSLSITDDGEIPRVFINVGFRSNNAKDDIIFDSVLGDRIIDPIVVLCCNDWNCYNVSKFLPLYIFELKGKRKELQYIDDNYEVCTSYTYLDDFGLHFKLVESNLMYVATLVMEYSKRVSK